jgi:hypothetical protein
MPTLFPSRGSPLPPTAKIGGIFVILADLAVRSPGLKTPGLPLSMRGDLPLEVGDRNVYNHAESIIGALVLAGG